ncbi:MAG: FtsX-like permease family protein [Frankiaceae bacterium]
MTLGAVGIATGLAAADGRPDLATLAAVGAGPWVRRRLAMAQAATVAVLGTVLGVVAGFVPGTASVRTRTVGGEGSEASRHMAVVMPWQTLAIVAVGVPLLAILTTGLLTRSRLPLVRRIG